MKVHISRGVSIGFVVGIVMLLFIVGADYRTNQSYQQATDQLNKDRQIDNTAASLLTAVLNAETGQRGYVITGSASYLAPYEGALLAVNASDSVLKSLTAGDSNLTSDYVQLQPLISEKFQEMNETIVARQTQGFAAAQAIVATNVGETYTDQIRTAIASLISTNDGALTQLQSSTTQLAAERLDLVYVFGLFGTAVIVFTYYALRREFMKEETLLAKESRSRMQTQLLQDILTHDIRNYNQISKSNAEILRENVDAEQVPLVDSIIKAVDGSSGLIARTKTLAKITSSESTNLKAVELEESIGRSLSLIAKAYPAQSVALSSLLEGESKVIADDLLDEVFVNVLSNAVKYTNSARVPIDITIEEGIGTGHADESETSRVTPYLKVSITDHGKGIPEGMKEKVFTRYQNSATGSGLGMSIVYALVVDRYSGRVRILDRVAGDYSKGTSVEIWLRKA
jgi:CHASE3 domain sensor protein